MAQRGMFALDGGAMFGVVPKALWARKYPADDDNTIPMVHGRSLSRPRTRWLS